MMRAIVVAVSLGVLGWMHSPLAAQGPGPPPGGRNGPPPGKGPPRSADEFIDRELEKLWEKARKDGDRFDAQREVQKFAEKLQKDFGVEPPPELIDEFLAAADDAALRAREIAERQPPPAVAPGAPPPGALPTARRLQTGEQTTQRLGRGTVYAENIPSWYSQRDRNGDGQLGLYEWPRGEYRQFVEMDGNNDGFLEQAEVQWFLARADTRERSTAAAGARFVIVDGRATSPPLRTVRPGPRGVGAGGGTNGPASAGTDDVPPKGPPQTPEAFVDRELQKFREKLARDPEKIDVPRELDKLQEKYAKDFGAPLPDDAVLLFEELTRDAGAGR